MSDVPKFFFMISSKILCKNPFNLFYFFYKITKIKIKNFECPKSIKSINKNNTWNIRLLVDDSCVPSSNQPIVIYCRLTDFRCAAVRGRHLYLIIFKLEFFSLYSLVIMSQRLVIFKKYPYRYAP